MMRDLIERFGYRLQLWSRERKEEYLGAGGTRPMARIYRKDESIPQMVIRHIGVLLGGIMVLTGVGRIIDTFAPKAAFVVFIVLMILIPFWVLAGVVALIGEWSAKKQKATGAQHHLTDRSIESQGAVSPFVIPSGVEESLDISESPRNRKSVRDVSTSLDMTS